MNRCDHPCCDVPTWRVTTFTVAISPTEGVIQLALCGQHRVQLAMTLGLQEELSNA